MSDSRRTLIVPLSNPPAKPAVPRLIAIPLFWAFVLAAITVPFVLKGIL